MSQMISREQLDDPTFKIPLSYFMKNPFRGFDPDPRKTLKANYKKWYGADWKTEWAKYKSDESWQLYKEKMCEACEIKELEKGVHELNIE